MTYKARERNIIFLAPTTAVDPGFEISDASLEPGPQDIEG